MSEKIRVGVIGCGNMGRHHARNYAEIEATELIAIADPNSRTSTSADNYGAQYYSDPTQMLDELELDAVSVAVPTGMHYQVASAALDRGLHVLVEKPMSTNLVEAENMIKQAEANDLILSVGHIERYNPVVERLKRMIDNQELGEILSIETRRVGGFPAVQPETDVIMDLAIHDIDILNYLMGCEGEIREVNGQQTLHSSEVDSVEMILNYNGISGILIANWVTPVKIRGITITGTRGYVEANYITQEITMYEKMRIVGQESFSDFVDAYGEPDVKIIRPAKKEPMRIQLGAFAMAIATGNRGNLVDPRDTLPALKTSIDAAAMLKERKLKLAQQNHNRI